MGKYIDADLLRKEIEKHIKEVKDAAERFTPNMGFFDAKLSGIYDVMAIIDSLQQEQHSLPDNLDEAAREIVIKMHPCLKDCTILGDRLTRGELMALVKAGAEWMANIRRERNEQM